MSSTTPIPNGERANGAWSYAAPLIGPPIAAGAAIVPAYYGFVAKSAQQLGKRIPRMTLKETLTGGFKAAPTLGVIIGTQVIVQKVVETAFTKLSKERSEPSLSLMVVSSTVVGVVSAPALAVFNGQTMGRTVRASLRSLSAWQTGAIVTRETKFLFSLRISDPVSEMLKKRWGNRKSIGYLSAFLSGAIGGVASHPADTALTLWQEGMRLESFRQSLRGLPMRATAVGGFALGFKIVKEALNPPKSD